MPTPAYLDLTLYLPAGGVNGFELDGFAINGVGFVDSPFAGQVFGLDPYRSILPMERGEVSLGSTLPSLLNPQPGVSVQGSDETASTVWGGRCETELRPDRSDSSLEGEMASQTIEVENVSFVPVEYRTAYVLASHPSTLPSARTDSDVDESPSSNEPDQDNVSTVPAEDRTTKVPR